MKKLRIALCCTMLIITLSCSSDNEVKDTSGLVLEFDSRVGTETDFVIGTTYQNELGQDFKLTELNYLVENIRLRKEDGTFVEQYSENTYALQEELNQEQLILLEGIPNGKYTAIEITLANISLEGTSPDSSHPDHLIAYRKTGAVYNVVKLFEFQHAVTLGKGFRVEAHFVLDVLKFFTGANEFDFAVTPECIGECGSELAENVELAILLDHIHD